MDSGWNPAFERIVAFKEVRKHDEHFSALIWSTGVNHILLTMSEMGSSVAIGVQAHRICSSEMEGITVQEF